MVFDRDEGHSSDYIGLASPPTLKVEKGFHCVFDFEEEEGFIPKGISVSEYLQDPELGVNYGITYLGRKSNCS